MRLVFTIPSLACGGAERVLCELANYFSKAHEVFIITLEQKKSLSFYPLDERIKLIYLDLPVREESLFFRVCSLFTRAYQIRREIKNINPDQVISFMDRMNILVLLSMLGKGIPVIVSERTHPKYHRIPWIHNWLRKILYPKAKMVVVQTVGVKEYFASLSNVLVIPNSIKKLSCLKKNYDSVENFFHVVSVGRLIVSKAFEDLFYAVKILSKQNIKLKITIYGEGNHRRNLEKMLFDLRLENIVSLKGNIKNLAELLPRADLFVFPSRYEGFPNALAEAMACGLPVIASNCSGNIALVQDKINGYLFEVGDFEKLRELIQFLIQNQVERERIGQKAKKVSQVFSENKIYQQWAHLIEHTATK